MRQSVAFLLCGCCLPLFAGCSHMTERRVVQAFSDSLKEHDLEKLRQSSSDTFEQKAIVGEETFEAMSMLDIPTGRHKITKVKKTKGDDEKTVVAMDVTAEIGDRRSGRKKLRYKLKPEGKSWVVEDVYLSPSDLRDNKSVASRTAILISVREAMEAWQAPNREKILAAATPEFADALEQLTPDQLSQFAKKITADVAQRSGVRTGQERIGEEISTISVPKLDGELVLKFRRVENRWKLDDLEVESRRIGEAVASVRQMSAAMSAAVQFQQAYRAADKGRLQEICTSRFFGGSLAGADLSTVKLPGTEKNMPDFDVKLEGASATFVIPAGPEILKLSLVRESAESLHDVPHYLIDDVTIYELKTSQDKRLSALFTGHAVLNEFNGALTSRNVNEIRKFATHDFNARVWSHISNEDLNRLPLEEVEPTQPKVVQTLFKGSVTEVLVDQGRTPLTYVLRDERGHMLVDDILIPTSLVDDDTLPVLAAGERATSLARPESLKASLELAMPAVHFAAGLERSDMVDVRKWVSQEFKRLVWDHYDETPPFDQDPLAHLHAPMTHAKILPGDRAVVKLGDDRFGARVSLVKEDGKYCVEDVLLVAGPEPEHRVGLKRTIRERYAQNR